MLEKDGKEELIAEYKKSKEESAKREAVLKFEELFEKNVGKESELRLFLFHLTTHFFLISFCYTFLVIGNAPFFRRSLGIFLIMQFGQRS